MQFMTTQNQLKPNSFLTIGSQVFKKQAGDGTPSNAESWKQIAGLGLTGLGIGGGTRALLGIRELLQNELAKRRTLSRPAVINVNVPQVQEEDEEIPSQRFQRRLKLAGDEEPSILQRILPFTSSNWWTGNNAESHINKPWFLPAATAATLGGLYGGYKLIGSGMNAIHKRDKRQELDDAKDEYRRALVEQYATDSPALKRADTQSELGKDLDELYEVISDEPLVKLAFGGAAMGAYLTLAGLLAGGTGAATYNWAKSKSPDERLAAAIRQRERLRWATRPPEIYAVARPTPIKVKNNPVELPEEEDDNIKKIAALYKP